MSQVDVFEDPYEYQKLIGFKITRWEPDFAEVTLSLARKHTNRYGIPHGGIHATLMDTALGFSGCFTGDSEAKKLAMTLSLTVNYVGPIKGTSLIATGRKVGGGAKTFFASGEIRDDLGNLVATATGTFRYRG